MAHSARPWPAAGGVQVARAPCILAVSLLFAGMVLPLDPLDQEAEWSCESCQNVIHSTEVWDVMNRLSEVWKDVN